MMVSQQSLSERLRSWWRRTAQHLSHAFRYPPNLWYLALVGVILCLFSVVLYATVTASLARDVDRTITHDADTISESLFAFWRAERASSGGGPGNWQSAPYTNFAAEVSHGGLPGLIEHWTEKTGQRATDHRIRLLSTEGKMLWASTPMERLVLPVPTTLASQTLRGQLTYYTTRQHGRHLRVATYPVRWGGRVLYVIQVATSLHGVDASRLKLCAWLLILVPATLLVTGSIMTLLAMQALWPLNQLAAHTQQFIAEALHERIEMPQSRDEVQQLSVVFSEMLVRLERAFHRLRQFSASAAHELRNTLTVMQGDVSVTLHQRRNPEEYHELLTTHLQTLREMTTTVEELLHFAQLEATGEGLERAPVELSQLVQGACDTFRAVAQEKAVQINVATNGPVWVQGERHLLERIIANLVDNAMKYTPADGRIIVAVESRDQQACVTVRDSGPGIAPSELPTIFDRFFTPRSAADHTHSTGLGLGLCRWIAEAHHGRIDVASQPGHGATFTVWLPLSSAS